MSNVQIPNLPVAVSLSGNEAVEMVQSGIQPSIVSGYIAQMPDEMDRAVATINFAAATYRRNNPLFLALMAANGKTDADADAFFIAAATL